MGPLETSIVEAALRLGADLAGIAAVADLPVASDVVWPTGALSVVVVAVAHPPERPELDWWYGRKDPPGNRLLAAVVGGLCDWAVSHLGAEVRHLPYHVERGGIYLKDAAVVAGLGCIGLNNLVVTPRYGPHVRLRALTIDLELSSTGPVAFDPCSQCGAPCRAACPRSAFVIPTRRDNARGGAYQPARDGRFSRPLCSLQMDADIGSAEEAQPPGFEKPVKIIKYCRMCEFSCPVGR